MGRSEINDYSCFYSIADREYFFNGAIKEDLFWLMKLWAPDLGVWIVSTAAVGMLLTFLQTGFNVREVELVPFRYAKSYYRIDKDNLD